MSVSQPTAGAAGTFVRPVLASLRSFWAEGRRVERACSLVGAVLIASGLFHLVVFAVDGGPWEGPVSWRKPTTFGLSFGLTLITIAWVASFLHLGDRFRTVLLSVFAVACVAETGMITFQAWRHVPSHFDMETPLNTVISMALAVGGGVLYSAGGFLKPVHGVTMHGILVLPGLAWLLSFRDMSERRRVRVIGWTTAAYAVAIVAVIAYSLARALAG